MAGVIADQQVLIHIFTAVLFGLIPIGLFRIKSWQGTYCLQN